MKEFYIYLTFDIDQDFSLNSNDYYNRNNVEFEGFSKGMPLIIEKLRGMPFSVFLRADSQIASVYGSYDYLLNEFSNIVDIIHNNNGEINWHIHIYKEKNNIWHQVRDVNETLDIFLEDLKEVKKIREINSSIVRIGECIMNNELMHVMSLNEIAKDSTALPGRLRNDSEKFFDWEITQNNFYNPSTNDYRTTGKLNHSLLEVPMSTVYMQAKYDSKPYKRYVNLAFKNEVLFQNLGDYVKENDHLVTMTHPYEILKKGQHGLISYDINVFDRNFNDLIKAVENAGKKPVFKKIGEI